MDKDVVRRVLAKHYHPGNSQTNGSSWLTFIGHAKDSLWSVDLFRIESILLRSYWVMLVMEKSSGRGLIKVKTIVPATDPDILLFIFSKRKRIDEGDIAEYVGSGEQWNSEPT